MPCPSSPKGRWGDALLVPLDRRAISRYKVVKVAKAVGTANTMTTSVSLRQVTQFLLLEYGVTQVVVVKASPTWEELSDVTASDFQFFPEIHHASPPVSEFVDDWTKVMAFAGAAGVRLDRLAAVAQPPNRRVVAAETGSVGGGEKLCVSGYPEAPVCSRK